jgi:hypothetical protein
MARERRRGTIGAGRAQTLLGIAGSAVWGEAGQNVEL